MQVACAKNKKGEFEPWFRNEFAKDYDAEIYRIGEDYYAKIPFHYFPYKTSTSLTWYTWCLFESANLPEVDYSSPPYVGSTYFKLHPLERRELDLPVPTAGPAAGKPLPDTLTEREAAKLHPTLVGAEHGIKKPISCKPECRHTWKHYAMMPATAITFVGVDVPCTVIGSVFGLIGSLIP